MSWPNTFQNHKIFEKDNAMCFKKKIPYDSKTRWSIVKRVLQVSLAAAERQVPSP